jgi:hypothetical protein
MFSFITLLFVLLFRVNAFTTYNSNILPFKAIRCSISRNKAITLSDSLNESQFNSLLTTTTLNSWRGGRGSLNKGSTTYRTNYVALMGENDDANEGSTESIKDTMPVNNNAVTSPSSQPSSYPLNVPSPILLGGAMLLSIVGIGTLFTSLTDKAPNVIGTAAVVGINVPVSLYLFYAAIKKGQAETEEDDKRLG